MGDFVNHHQPVASSQQHHGVYYQSSRAQVKLTAAWILTPMQWDLATGSTHSSSSVSTRAASTYCSQRSLQGALDVQQCESVRLQLLMGSAEAFSL